jgi:hypothetical protein
MTLRYTVLSGNKRIESGSTSRANPSIMTILCHTPLAYIFGLEYDHPQGLPRRSSTLSWVGNVKVEKLSHGAQLFSKKRKSYARVELPHPRSSATFRLRARRGEPITVTFTQQISKKSRKK